MVKVAQTSNVMTSCAVEYSGRSGCVSDVFGGLCSFDGTLTRRLEPRQRNTKCCSPGLGLSRVLIQVAFHALQETFQCRTFTFLSENFSAYFSKVPTFFQPLSVKSFSLRSLFRELLPLLIEEHDRQYARPSFGECFRSRVQSDSKQAQSIS